MAIDLTTLAFPRVVNWFGNHDTNQAQALSRCDMAIAASYKFTASIAALKALRPGIKVPFYAASEQFNPYPASQQDDLGGVYHWYDPPANGGVYTGWFAFTTQLASLGASNPLPYVAATATAVAATGSQTFTLTATGGTVLTDISNGDSLWFDVGGANQEQVTLTAWNSTTGAGTATFTKTHPANAVVKKSPATFTVDSTGNAANFPTAFGGVNLSSANWLWVRIDDESIPVQGISGTTFTIKTDPTTGVPIRGGIKTAAKTHAASAPIKMHGGTLVYNSVELNVSSQCPVAPSNASDPAVQNKTWGQWLASFVASRVQANGFDGVWFDTVNTTYQLMNASALDANNDGTADAGNGPSGVGAWWKDGQQALWTATRSALDALSPGVYYVLGNAWNYGGGNGWQDESIPHYGIGYTTLSQPLAPFDRFIWRYLSQTTDATLLGGLDPAASINAGPFNTTTTNGLPPFTYQSVRFAFGIALLGNGYFSLDYGSHGHGATWWLDEMGGGQGSSLATALTASTANTSVAVAAGTGPRFQVGQVVYVAIDGEPAAGTVQADATVYNDEPMYVTAIGGDTLTVVRNSVDGTVNSGPKLGAHWAGQTVLTAAQMVAGRNWLGRARGAYHILGWSNAGATGLSVDAATWAHGQFDGWTGTAFPGWTFTTGGGAAATLANETTGANLRAGGGAQCAKVAVTTPSTSGFNVKLLNTGAVSVGRPAAGQPARWYSALVWLKTDQTSGHDADVRVYNAATNQTRAQQRWTLYPSWAPYYIAWREEAAFAGTLGAAVSTTGTHTVALAANAGSSLADIQVGEHLTIDAETVQVTAWDGTNITATFGATHASGAAVSSATYSLSLSVDVAYDAGTVWIDSAQLLDGDAHLFRRDFENGCALVNGTGQTVTVPLPSAYRTIAGTQDATHNTGQTVTSVTLQPQDAYLLATLPHAGRRRRR